MSLGMMVQKSIIAHSTLLLHHLQVMESPAPSTEWLPAPRVKDAITNKKQLTPPLPVFWTLVEHFFVLQGILADQIGWRDNNVVDWSMPMFGPHICFLYSPGPVPAVLDHRMGIWFNPLKNGLIQHTSKIPSNTWGLDATFSCWPQVSMMFQ